jgi:hypothetical protein
VTVPPQQTENFRRPMEMMQCQQQKRFAGKICFLNADTLLKMGSWQHSTGKRTCSIWSKINSRNVCCWSEHKPGNRSFYTHWRSGDEINLCQDGAQESRRATAGCTVERSLWHPIALRRCCSLLTDPISYLATSFCFKKLKRHLKDTILSKQNTSRGL